MLKRMRIGNSKLKSHYRQGKSKICTNCDLNVPETNEHFLIVCKKFKNQRDQLVNDIEEDRKRLKVKINTKRLIGFYPEIYVSKIRIKRN